MSQNGPPNAVQKALAETSSRSAENTVRFIELRDKYQEQRSAANEVPSVVGLKK